MDIYRQIHKQEIEVEYSQLYLSFFVLRSRQLHFLGLQTYLLFFENHYFEVNMEVFNKLINLLNE